MWKEDGFRCLECGFSGYGQGWDSAGPGASASTRRFDQDAACEGVGFFSCSQAFFIFIW